MITWAMDQTQESFNSDLLELYCGGGTFTAPMSRNFRNVLATEISKASVDLAHKNFALNEIKNIKVARLSSEEFSDAYNGKKTFSRLVEGKIDLKSYDISTVLVDPPRAGIDPLTLTVMSQFSKIVYISCNPETLARDVKALSNTHNLVRVAAFDQFPYTHHLESGAVLIKKAETETGFNFKTDAETEKNETVEQVGESKEVGQKHALEAEQDQGVEKTARLE